MLEYSFGVETVPVAVSRDILAGSVHDGSHYRILVAKLKGGKIGGVRFISGENDWEGHSVFRMNDGFLLGGAVEGVASAEGGHGWKAYVVRIDEDLRILWDRKLELGGNGVVYSIVRMEDRIIVSGEHGTPGKRGFFIGSLSPEGRLLWLRKFGYWSDVVFSSLLVDEDGLSIIGSVYDGGWMVRRMIFDLSGEMVGEAPLAEGIALSAILWEGRIVLAGYRGSRFWIRVGSTDYHPGDGTATSLFVIGDSLIAGGEMVGNAAIVEISMNGDLSVRELWKNGSVEAIGEGAVFGVRTEGGKTRMVICPYGDFDDPPS